MSNTARRIQGDLGKRQKRDFYPTPPEGTIPLLENENFTGDIWEPACGDGSMSRVLEWALPNKIISSDIYDYGYGEQEDFLKSKRRTDNVITNPPYSLATEFAYHALDRAKNKIALLVKIQFLESIKRHDLFKNTPLKTVYVFSRRLKIYKNGIETGNSTMFCFSWFVWDKSLRNNIKPTIDWVFPSLELHGKKYD